MKNKILKLLIIFFFSLPSASYSLEPDVFVQSTVNRAADTLGGNLSKEERIEELKKIAKDTVDIRGIGFYSLGSHRKGLSDEKKKNIQKCLKIIL